MNKKDVCNIHLLLDYKKGTDGLMYFSSLCGALKDARKMTGRNINTGEKDSSNTFGHLGSWLGTMGYIIILDQIGKCYKPKDKDKIESQPAIIKALRYFSSLDDPEIDALYALRNAFFHDYSLWNKDNPKNIHRFLVDNHPFNKIIILPKDKWDGKLETRNECNSTYINLQAVGDLVEKIYKILLALNNEDKLEVELEGKESELLARYIIAIG